MINTTVVSLLERQNWDPAALTAEALEWPWRSQHTLPVRDLTRSLLPDAWVEQDVPVITPGSLDPIAGGVESAVGSTVGQPSRWGASSAVCNRATCSCQ